MFSKKIVLILFILLNIMVFSATYLQMRKYGTLPVDVSSAMPEFSWQDYEGKTHHSKELLGKTVVIHFWATWCGPCRKEFPILLRAAQKLAPDIVFLTISGDEELQNAKLFVEKSQKAAGVNPDNVLYAFDPDKKIAFDIFQTAVYPESIIVDKTGHMRQKFPGVVRWENEEVQNRLKTIGTQAN